MEYSILDCFMISAVSGVLFGIVYELLRLLRRIFRFRIVTFFCDILFFVLAGFVIVRLSMYLGSYIRVYTILGFAGGVFAYVQTVGRLVYAISSVLILVVDRSVGSILRFILKQAKGVFGVFAHNASALFGRIADFITKIRKKHLSHLNFGHDTLYNIKRDKKTIGESGRGSNVIKVKIKRSS